MFIFVNGFLRAIGPRNIPHKRGLFPVIDMYGMRVSKITLAKTYLHFPGIRKAISCRGAAPGCYSKEDLDYEGDAFGLLEKGAKWDIGDPDDDEGDKDSAAASSSSASGSAASGKNRNRVSTGKEMTGWAKPPKNWNTFVLGADNQTVVYKGPIKTSNARNPELFLGANAIGNGTIPYCDLLKGFYFEVRLDGSEHAGAQHPSSRKSRRDSKSLVKKFNELNELDEEDDELFDDDPTNSLFDDGLTIGITKKHPKYFYAKRPATIDECSPCWCAGYDGATFGYLEWQEHEDVTHPDLHHLHFHGEKYHPGRHLRLGDRIGMLIVPNDAVSLLFNGHVVVSRKYWDDLSPGKFDYYPMVDLLGGSLEATFCPVFIPPLSRVKKPIGQPVVGGGPEIGPNGQLLTPGLNVVASVDGRRSALRENVNAGDLARKLTGGAGGGKMTAQEAAENLPDADRLPKVGYRREDIRLRQEKAEQDRRDELARKEQEDLENARPEEENVRGEQEGQMLDTFPGLGNQVGTADDHRRLSTEHEEMQAMVGSVLDGDDAETRARMTVIGNAMGTGVDPLAAAAHSGEGVPVAPTQQIMPNQAQAGARLSLSTYGNDIGGGSSPGVGAGLPGPSDPSSPEQINTRMSTVAKKKTKKRDSLNALWGTIPPVESEDAGVQGDEDTRDASLAIGGAIELDPNDRGRISRVSGRRITLMDDSSSTVDYSHLEAVQASMAARRSARVSIATGGKGGRRSQKGSGKGTTARGSKSQPGPKTKPPTAREMRERQSVHGRGVRGGGLRSPRGGTISSSPGLMGSPSSPVPTGMKRVSMPGPSSSKSKSKKHKEKTNRKSSSSLKSEQEQLQRDRKEGIRRNERSRMADEVLKQNQLAEARGDVEFNNPAEFQRQQIENELTSFAGARDPMRRIPEDQGGNYDFSPGGRRSSRSPGGAGGYGGSPVGGLGSLSPPPPTNFGRPSSIQSQIPTQTAAGRPTRGRNSQVGIMSPPQASPVRTSMRTSVAPGRSTVTASQRGGANYTSGGPGGRQSRLSNMNRPSIARPLYAPNQRTSQRVSPPRATRAMIEQQFRDSGPRQRFGIGAESSDD